MQEVDQATWQCGNTTLAPWWPRCWYVLLKVVVKVRIQIGLSFLFWPTYQQSSCWPQLGNFQRGLMILMSRSVSVELSGQLWEQCEEVKLKSFLQGWNPAKGLPGGKALGMSEACTFCGPVGTLWKNQRNHDSIALLKGSNLTYSWMWLFHEPQYVLISQRYLNSRSQGAWWQFAVVVLDERHQKRRCPTMTTFESQKCYFSSLNYLWAVNFSCFLGILGCAPICSHFSYCCFCMSLRSSLAWGQRGRSAWWEIVLHLWFNDLKLMLSWRFGGICVLGIFIWPL